MSFIRTSVVLAALSFSAIAHPMGNFSVNHYSRLHFHQSGVDLTYVLDFAEIPTFQLMDRWRADHDKQAKEWVDNLALLQNGRKVDWQIRSITAKTSDGAGGMAVLRVAITAYGSLEGGEIRYSDGNFPGRAGWKEIVIDRESDAVLHRASQGSLDLSKALTVYPTDPSITPPQDLSATVEWSPAPTMTATAKVEPGPASASFTEQQPSAPGSVVRGDFLSRMLQQRNLGWRLMLLCVAAAFGLGAMHAMSPGHGKTIVAAYLVGSRGRSNMPGCWAWWSRSRIRLRYFCSVSACCSSSSTWCPRVLCRCSERCRDCPSCWWACRSCTGGHRRSWRAAIVMNMATNTATATTMSTTMAATRTATRSKAK